MREQTDVIAELEAAFEATTQGKWEVDVPMAGFCAIRSSSGEVVYFTAAQGLPNAEGNHQFAVTAHNKWPALLDVARKARAVANEGWGTCITDQQHSRRMAKMDALREALKAL